MALLKQNGVQIYAEDEGLAVLGLGVRMTENV